MNLCNADVSLCKGILELITENIYILQNIQRTQYLWQIDLYISLSYNSNVIILTGLSTSQVPICRSVLSVCLSSLETVEVSSHFIFPESEHYLAFEMRSGGSESDVAEDWGLVWCDAMWLTELFPTFRNAVVPSYSRASSPFFFDWMNLEGLFAEQHSATSQMFVLCSLTISRNGSEFMCYVDADKRLTWRACNVTAQSIQWMFRKGAFGKRFRYCDWRFLFETCRMPLSFRLFSNG